MVLKKKNIDTYYFTSKKNEVIVVSKKELEFVKIKSKHSKRNRSRLCTHTNQKDKIHEMFIYHPKNAYVRPHKNIVYGESFFLINGRVDLILFNQHGKIIKFIKLNSKKGNFYYKIAKNTFHSQIFHTNSVFFEITQGPFNKKNNVFANWAPEEKDIESVKKFQKQIIKKNMNN